LGVYNRIRSEGYQFDRVVIKTETNVKIRDYFLGNEKLFGYDALRINREILLATLRKSVQDQGILIKYGRKFSQVTAENEDTVSFEFEDGSTESASLLIGADGIHSEVRRYIHPTASPVYTGIMALVSTVDRSTLRFPSPEAADNYLPCFITGKHGAFVMIPQSPDGNTITAFSHTQLPDRDKAGWDDLRSDIEKLLAMQMHNKEEWPDFVQSVMENIQSGTTTAWPYSFMPHLDTWTSPAKRVVLLGDAAHAIPPASGQGAAQAFEDAYSLSLLLSNLSPQIKFEAGVDWWQQYRMERTKAILVITQIMNEKRLPRAKQRNPDREWQGREEGNELEQQGWLYMPKVQEDTLVWVETQKQK
jgi:2-polyprenyl-6-methoxyphenol hydroxylase-like FAD-dependent oxidoreductase